MSQTLFPETVTTRDAKTGLCHYDFSAYSEKVPREWLESLERYFNEGIAPGGFLRAVLENSFYEAIRNLHPCYQTAPVILLFQLTDMLLEGAPSGAWGSAAQVAEFLALREEGKLYERARAQNGGNNV